MGCIGIGGIGGAPVGRGCAFGGGEGAPVEIGAADGGVVGSGGEAADGEAVFGGIGYASGISTGIATGRTGVAGGYEDGNTLGGGSLPEVVVLDVSGCAVEPLTFAVAHIHDTGGEVVDDEALRVVEGVVGGRAWIRRDEDDLGLGSDGAGPLDIEGVLDQVADLAWIGGIGKGSCCVGANGDWGTVAGDERGRGGGGVAGQEEIAEGGDIVGDDAAGSGDGDGLPAAVDTGGPEGKDVIDGGEVVGADVFDQVWVPVGISPIDAELGGGFGGERAGGRASEAGARSRRGYRRFEIGDGACGGRWAQPSAGFAVFGDQATEVVERMGEEIVEGFDADDDRRQRGGNLRVAHVGDVRDAIDDEIVNLGVEGALHLGRVAAEADGHAVFGDFTNGETVAGKPIRNGGDVDLGRAEVGADLIGSEPLVVVGRVGVVLAGDKLLKRRLLSGIATEDQDQVGHGEAGTDQAAIVARVRDREGVALEGGQAGVVNALDDSDGGRKSLRSQGGRAEEGRDY